MTLKEVLTEMAIVDGLEDDVEKALALEVEFCTKNRCGLVLISVYESDGKICIDIGEEGE